MNIDTQAVKVSEGRRKIDTEKVTALAESIKDIGLINAITITPDFTLIAGAHRLEAFKLLGRETIPANVIQLSGLAVELAEIDENLIRNDLSYVGRGELMLRRKEIYEALHPETKAGGDRRSDKFLIVDSTIRKTPSFTEDTAVKIGVSRSVVEQEIKLAKDLTPEAKEAVKIADITKTNALKLARLNPEEQNAVVAQVTDKQTLSITDAINEVQHKAATERPRQPHVANNSGNHEWYTPPEYINAAREVMGDIDLDPASSDIANKIVKATRYYTINNDGLKQDWHGHVWMNPPYASDSIYLFTEKLAKHYIQGDVQESIVLVNNATETAWFYQLVAVSAAIVFPRTRVKFQMPDGKTGAPLQGQAILYLGKHPDKFLDVFFMFGWGSKLDARANRVCSEGEAD
jgi:ParB family chromosome partitioning protein